MDEVPRIPCAPGKFYVRLHCVPSCDLETEISSAIYNLYSPKIMFVFTQGLLGCLLGFWPLPGGGGGGEGDNNVNRKPCCKAKRFRSKFSLIMGLVLSSSEQPGSGALLLGLAKSVIMHEQSQTKHVLCFLLQWFIFPSGMR